MIRRSPGPTVASIRTTEGQEAVMLVTVRQILAALGVAIVLGAAPASALADAPAKGTSQPQHQEIVIVKSIDVATMSLR
jgi:hypothetical protein